MPSRSTSSPRHRRLPFHAPAFAAVSIAALGLHAQAQAPADDSLAPLAAPTTLNRDMGAPQSAVAVLDDAVPAPLRRETRTTENGDEITSTVADDPYYLGFIGGRYFPPADERLDPELVAQAAQAAADARTETYGFVMLGKRMTAQRRAALEALGVRPLEFHPYYCVKAALPVERLDDVAALDFVRWIGVARPNLKLHPKLAELAPGDDGRLALYVDVFESDLCESSTWTPAAIALRADGSTLTPADGLGPIPKLWQSHGKQHQALAELGVEIVEYVDSIRAFRVRASAAQVEQLVGLDGVQFIEPDLPRELMHDESTPMIGTDFTRTFFSGNSSGAISIAQADSGVDFGHVGLSIAGWIWDFTGGPWMDGCEHGSHVMGTILGNGSGSTSFSLAGVAPGLARSGSASRAFVARVFNNACGWAAPANSTIFSVNRSGFWDGSGFTTKPQLSSNSWNIPGVGWVGTEAQARDVDFEVFNHDQLYLFAAGNSGPGAQTIGLEATAKNALTVGSVVDFYAPVGFPGTVAGDSSRGPCGDGRWKPNVAAPGDQVMSVDANSTNGYKSLSGTSMATPHVAGLAAQITDAAAWLRYQPEGLAAVLMSSAETKGGVTLSTPTDSHLRNYGAGRVEAHKAILGSGDYWWNTWVFDAPWPNWQFADFTVPANCKRITVCMNYYEPEASAGASQALINDWDLYLDDPSNGIDANGNTGDWVAQQSTLDNVEIRSLDNPSPGVWRWKAWPQNVTWFSTVKMAVSVTYEVNTSSATPSLDVYTSATYVKPNQQVDIYAWAANGSGLASGASLDQFSTGDALVESAGQLFDGAITNHMNNPDLGRNVELGDIPPGFGRGQRWRTSWPTEGVKNFGAYLDCDNTPWLVDSVNITVDGTPPTPVVISSSSHSQLVWSNDPTIDLNWATPSDNLSGVAGYSWALFSGGIPLDPGTTQNLGLVNNLTVFANSSSSATYFCMRPVDNAGNWTNGYSWAVPFLIDTVAPSAPVGPISPTHHVSVPNCGTTVTMNWGASFDSHSGLAGYLYVWDTSPSTTPTGATNLAAGSTSVVTNIGSSATARYFHLRAKDLAGNSGPTVHFGPVLANANTVGAYCVGKVNSLGCTPAIGWINQPDKSAGNFTVTCSNVLNQKNGLLFWGFSAISSPFQGGTLCVGSPTIRTPSFGSGGAASGSSCTGAYSFTFSTAYMNAYGMDPGEAYFAQWWMRDPSSPSTTGLSNAVYFTVCE